MFREMRRAKQQLSEAECVQILESCTSGVLALSGDEGYPYAVPLSYLYVDGKLIFHGARTGHKLDAMRKNDKASFCVIKQDEVLPEKYTTAYKSVIVFGRMRILENPEDIRDAALALGEKYYPGHHASAAAEAVGAMPALCVFMLDIEHMSGKQGKELLK